MLRKMYFKMPPCQQLGDLIQRVDTAQGVLFATAMRQRDVAGHILDPRYTTQYTGSVETAHAAQPSKTRSYYRKFVRITSRFQPNTRRLEVLLGITLRPRSVSAKTQ